MNAEYFRCAAGNHDGYLPTADYRNDSPLYPDATLDQKK